MARRPQPAGTHFRGPLLGASGTAYTHVPADVIARSALGGYRTLIIDFSDEAAMATNGAGGMLMTPTGSGFGATPAPTIAVARRTAVPFVGIPTLQLTPSDGNNEGTQLAWGTPGGGPGVAADGISIVGGSNLVYGTTNPYTVFYSCQFAFRVSASDHTGGAFAFGLGAHPGTTTCALDTNGQITSNAGALIRVAGANTLECAVSGLSAFSSFTKSVSLVEGLAYVAIVKGTVYSVDSVGNGSGFVEFFWGPSTNTSGGPLVKLGEISLANLGNIAGVAPIVCGVRLTAAVTIEVANVVMSHSIPTVV